MNYYEYIQDIKNKKGIWTYYSDINTDLYEEEYNYLKEVLKDKANKQEKITKWVVDFKNKEKDIIDELKRKEVIKQNFDYNSLTDKEKIIDFWTKVFDQRQKKMNNGEEMNEEDCFWLILSSKQFLDIFGSSEGIFQVYRTNIIKILQKYGVDLGGTSEKNKKYLENQNYFNNLLTDAKFRQDIINDNNNAILDIYFEIPTQKGEIKVEGEVEAEMKPDYFKNFLIKEAQNALESGYFTSEKKGVKKTQVKLAIKVKKKDKKGKEIEEIQRTTIATVSEGTKREQVFSTTEKNSKIFKEIQEAAESTGYNFKTAEKKDVKDYLAWAYRVLKDGRYDGKNSEEAKKFREMSLDLIKVEERYFQTFCKAIAKTFEKMEENNIVNLSLGIKKYIISKEQIEKAYNYISYKGKYELFKLLKKSESLHFLGYLYRYEIQSGTIGELLAIKNFKDFEPKSTGQSLDTNKEGKSLGQAFEDVNTSLGGINVKHYMSQDFPANLYGGSWSLESNYLEKYISKDLQELLIYFNINAPYFGEKIDNIKEILIILNKNFPYFYRLLRINDNKNNIFYQINNLIIPSSLILEEFIDKSSNTSFFTFENTNQQTDSLESNGNLLSCLEKTKNLGTKINFTGFTV